MTAIYMGDWSSEQEMLNDFKIPDTDGYEVLFASYTYEDYSGSAYVLLRKDGKYYEVHGGHCSCYGLSETNYMGSTSTQWEPEETDLESIKHRLTKGSWGEEERVKETLIPLVESLSDWKFDA